MIQIIRFTK
ncbi:hypothetical protein [Plasmodium yoelii yoelii]|uniref:Uncharacterized protein n=1 Tax=Plasmodium yoelii yoelii TaxID=73239 RepID=Q7RGW1_PLAYO|nr:hypothetical protein [Plasmodium yoelii yoelii]